MSVTQLTCVGLVFFFTLFLTICTEENVELEKAREEWEALENIQPGHIYLAVLPVWILRIITL